ncbi:mitogen-activated protein kinase kinase kinase 5 [Striga hermonthica]|uniref:mitogen-activated protein kinase kinase kinase n=1 Tax=Striga hermonthica TaxID=68872 RepID=A0A9N7RQV7_STRHE|nr:mitogen-activated protein kinase kinase kinase 5 [Striga hermonthica]
MHWWHGAFTSTSKSQSRDDSFVVGESGGLCGKPGFFSSRRGRMFSRARKVVHASESDVETWRSRGNPNDSASRASASASAVPQPLPLPELHVLLQRDPKYAGSGHCSVPLPSPEVVHDIPRGWEDRERERTEVVNGEEIDQLRELKRLVGQDPKTNSERSEKRSSTVSSRQNKAAKDQSSDVCGANIPVSAPTSPYSTRIISPSRGDIWTAKYMTPPGVFQVWSAPEIPHSDWNMGQGFSSQTLPERNTSSLDNSPLQSPRISTHLRATSPRRTPSPLNSRLSTETPLTKWDNNAQSNVHPLPLPPGPAMSSQVHPISPVGTRLDTSGASMLSPSVHNITSESSSLSSGVSKPNMMPRKSKWQKGKLIGRGTFGSVYVASNRETGALCAMKEVEILPDDSKSTECMRQLEQEIKVLRRLKHPNIVQYFGSEIAGDKFYIYLEYVHPGSINRFIQDHCGAITESVVRNFTRHILCGLAYLHSKKTIHRDIKGANLLVDAYGVVKLADFGMAKHLNGQKANLSLKGSPYWMAPELLQSATQTDASTDIALAVDIWSLGCTIIEMMNGKPPWGEYEGAAALFKVLTESPPIPNTMSAEGKDFLQCCFRRNPAERPTASELLDHPFVRYSQQFDACTHSYEEPRLLANTKASREHARRKSDQGPYDLKQGKSSTNRSLKGLAKARFALLMNSENKEFSPLDLGL